LRPVLHRLDNELCRLHPKLRKPLKIIMFNFVFFV